MKDKHKIFELEFNEQSNKGVYSIHLVKSPAMQGNFMKFKEQEKAVKFVDVDREKRIVAGLVLEPNKIIPRVNGADSIVITGIEGTTTVAFTPTYFSYYII